MRLQNQLAQKLWHKAISKHSMPLTRLLTVIFSILLFATEATALAQSFTSTSLPIVLLNKREPWQLIDSSWDGFEIVVDMSIIDNGEGKLNTLNDPQTGYKGKVKIKVQGSSSVAFPKRSFRITTVNEKNENTDASLAGLPLHEDWILKSLYQDKSLMRDDLAFHIYNEMGHYSSRSRFVELFVDGDYRGVYQLLEKVKRDKHRVHIAKLTPEENSGDDVTGGYIISLDKYKPGIDKGWHSKYMSNATLDSANFFLYYYPKGEVITEKQKAYIRGYFDRFEDALAGKDAADPNKGYRKYIDVQSFADNFIVNELSRNVDGYRSSTYFHKDKESSANNKLQAGPIWDYNIAFGNAFYNGGNDPYWWAYDHYAYINYTPWWWRRLLSDSTFRRDLRERYIALRKTILHEDTLYAYIDSKVSELKDAQVRNFQRYPILGQFVHPNPSPVPQTWAAEVAYLKWWLHERLQWMDKMICGAAEWDSAAQAYRLTEYNGYPKPFSENYLTGRTLQAEVLAGTKNFRGARSADSSALPSGSYIMKLSEKNGKEYRQLTKKTEDK